MTATSQGVIKLAQAFPARLHLAAKKCAARVESGSLGLQKSLVGQSSVGL
jgi:hypothetical protein